jgi:hypothetical protein
MSDAAGLLEFLSAATPSLSSGGKNQPGVAGDSARRLYERPSRPGFDEGRSRFKDPHHSVRPHGRKRPFFGYNNG